MPRVKLLIGALSAAGYLERRAGCLSTWANVADRDDVDVVFLVGDVDCGLPRRDGAILYCPCPDNYASLPQKTRWFCLWALANYEFDYLFKCDDDTYVHIDRLLTCGATADYVGYNLKGYASGGAGYLLSRNAAISVVGRLFEATGSEDVLVQAVLKQANIPFTPDARFHPWRDAWPQPDNQLITGHYCDAARMQAIHRQFAAIRRAKPITELSIPRLFHHIWLGGTPVPEKFQEYIESWRNHHPAWDFRLWNEGNLFPLQNQREFDAAPTPAQKADIARYEIVHRYGGVYLDTDFECRKNIEPLLEGLIGFAAEEDDDSVAIGVIGATPNHPLLGKVIAALPEWFARGGNPVRTTGPSLFTHFARGRSDFQIFDRRLFYPRHFLGQWWGSIEDAYAVHHWAHSWRAGPLATDGSAVQIVPCGNAPWKWAVAVTTAPRPQSTLARTLASLATTGFPEVMVQEDVSHAGSWPTWLAALRRLVNAAPDAQAYLMVQDDVVFCRNLRSHLERTLWPSPATALCSPFSPGAYRREKAGWHRENHGWEMVSAMCWAIPTATAKHMLEALSDIVSFSRVDAIVGRWAANQGHDCWYHTPSLAQHIGLRNSALGDNLVTDLREAYDFIGEEATP